MIPVKQFLELVKTKQAIPRVSKKQSNSFWGNKNQASNSQGVSKKQSNSFWVSKTKQAISGVSEKQSSNSCSW